MLLMLSLHPSRLRVPRTPQHITFVPDVERENYVDGFGNACTRIVAPARADDDQHGVSHRGFGRPDIVAPEAKQHAVKDLPEESLVSLLGSRYCDTDHLGDFAWQLFGNAPPGWARVQAICDFVHDHITLQLPECARRRAPPGTAFDEQKGVCRDFAHLAITLCRCMNIPARYCTGYLGDIGMPPVAGPDGLQRLVRGLSRRPLVHVRRAPQHAAHRPHPDGARPRCHRRGDLDGFGPNTLASFKVITDGVAACDGSNDGSAVARAAAQRGSRLIRLRAGYGARHAT